jgi:hypothetical protein
VKPQQLADYTVGSNGEGKSISVTGEGHLMDFQAGNDDTDSSFFVQLFDRVDRPNSGARPARVWEIPANASVDVVIPNGRPFKAGLLLVWSSTRNTHTLAAVSPTGRVGWIEASFCGKEPRP